jgi:hypothetical protein
VSYEALIAAQAKRLTKKRERGFMQYDWPSAEQITDRFDRMAWRDDCRAEGVTWGVKEVTPTHFDGCRTYADLYVPPAPERVELSHTEWADGYRKWRADADVAYHGSPCFAENEI